MFNFFLSTVINLASKCNSDSMSIFRNKKEINKYKDKTVVLNSIRTNVNTAVKIDELVQVCRAETGNSNISKK